MAVEVPLGFTILDFNISQKFWKKTIELTRMLLMEQNGKLEDWKCGSVEVWKCGSVEVWKCGSVEVWKCGSVEVWKCGSVEVWKCGSVEERKVIAMS